MNGGMDASYLRKIRQEPWNERHRRSYARWLAAHGRGAAAAWLEAEIDAVAHPGDLGACEAFHHARAPLSPSWRLTFEQPALLRTTGLPLTPCWLGIGLGTARPARGTYQVYRYGSLPPVVEHLASSWAWIERGPAPTLVNGSLSRHLAVVEGMVANAGYALPADFALLFDRFVGQRTVVRSCTGARFVLHPAVWTPAEVFGGLVVPFLHDEETSTGWGLWVHPSGSEAVLAFRLTPSIGDEAPPPRISRTHQAVDLSWVSPSLTSFVYRFELENQIWFAQHGRGTRTLEHQAYMAHYREARPRLPTEPPAGG